VPATLVTMGLTSPLRRGTRPRQLPRGGVRRPVASSSYSVVLSILFAAGLIYTLLGAVLLPAARSLSHDLHASQIDTTWVLTAYILSGGVATPIAGRLGDMYGKQRTLVWVLVVVAAGTLLCAVSTSLVPMIAGRLISGVASGVFPLAYGIIRDEFPAERVATAIGVISVSVGIGTGVAVVLAGFLLENLPYHWLFWVPLATTVPTLIAAWLWIPESPVRPGGRMDWVGALVMGLGLLGLLIGISKASTWGWASGKTIGLLGAGIAILFAWVRIELRTESPLIDMHTMAIPTVWRTNLAATLFGFGMFAAFATIPQFVEQPPSTGYGYGASVVGAGLYLMPAAVTMALIGPLAGKIERRTGSKRALLLGGASGTLGYALVALSHGVPWHLYVAMGIVGVGMGLGFAALPTLIVAAVPAEQTGAATGINTIMRVIGGALGIQICATIVARQTGPGGLPLESGFATAFWVCAAALAGASVVAALVPRRQKAPAGQAIVVPE
jgi:MFS family permease